MLFSRCSCGVWAGEKNLCTRCREKAEKLGDRRSRCCGLELLGSIQAVSVPQAAKNTYSPFCTAVKAEHQTAFKHTLKHSTKTKNLLMLKGRTRTEWMISQTALKVKQAHDGALHQRENPNQPSLETPYKTRVEIASSLAPTNIAVLK